MRFAASAVLVLLVYSAHAQLSPDQQLIQDQIEIGLHEANLEFIRTSGSTSPTSIERVKQAVAAANTPTELVAESQNAMTELNRLATQAENQAQNLAMVNPMAAQQEIDNAIFYSKAALLIAESLAKDPGLALPTPAAAQTAQTRLANNEVRKAAATQAANTTAALELINGSKWYSRRADQWEVTYATPSLRTYLDIGNPDDGDLKIFSEGELTPVVTLAELYYPMEFGSLFGGRVLPGTFPTRKVDGEDRPAWYWGPTFGIGITSPADDSEDSTAEATGAPVILATIGWASQFMIDENVTLVVEAGGAYGIANQEDGDLADDTGLYVGVGLLIPFQ